MFTWFSMGVLALLWLACIVAICCICAAGGAADAETEKWYAEHGQSDKTAFKAKKGAA
jgi:hypothetical protein